jgi:hypothetical protein
MKIICRISIYLQNIYLLCPTLLSFVYFFLLYSNLIKVEFSQQKRTKIYYVVKILTLSLKKIKLYGELIDSFHNLIEYTHIIL